MPSGWPITDWLVQTILYADKGSLLTVHAADDGGLSIEFSAGWQDAVQGVELGHGNMTWTQIFPP